MVSLIRLTVSLGILLHGYFYIRYETVHPCRAAVVRSVEDQDPLFTVGARALLGDDKADEALAVIGKILAKERGYPFCYQVAVLGTPGKSGF